MILTNLSNKFGMGILSSFLLLLLLDCCWILPPFHYLSGVDLIINHLILVLIVLAFLFLLLNDDLLILVESPINLLTNLSDFTCCFLFSTF